MTIELKEYNAVLIDPIVKIKKVEDNLEEKTCSIHVNFSGDGYSFSPIFYGFKYTSTWEDKDVLAWVNEELNKYKSK